MFFLMRPSGAQVELFLRASAQLTLSFKPGTIGPATGFAADATEGIVGHGERAFACACDALRNWEQWKVGWLEVLPDGAPTDPGTTLALRIRHLGFWSLNGARVVTVDETPGRRFAVSYGTLENHAERGQEWFEVLFDDLSKEVTYRIHAFSRPAALLARLGAPIVRRLQARARGDSLEAMRRAVARRTENRERSTENGS